MYHVLYSETNHVHHSYIEKKILYLKAGHFVDILITKEKHTTNILNLSALGPI